MNKEARFGSALRPEPRTLPDAQEQHLRALMTRRRQLIDIRTAESNRLARAAAAVRQRIILSFRTQLPFPVILNGKQIAALVGVAPLNRDSGAAIHNLSF